MPFFVAINTAMSTLLAVSGFTLVDITCTNVTYSRPEQEKERNQQRNWETVIQCVGLRTQPLNIRGPKRTQIYCDTGHFGEIYTGQQNIWCFTFNVERHGIWQVGEDPLELLHRDFDQVPIIQGLDETARFKLPIFYTSGAIKNVFFRLGQLDLNII